LKHWIKSGKVASLWSGTPCEGLSRARRAPPHSNFPGPLRSNTYVRGLPGLSAKDQAKLNRSNRLADRAGAILKLCLQHNLPCGEENPATSFLWDFRSRKQLARHPRCHQYVVDYCASGTPFRARTRLLIWNAPLSTTLQRMRCTGRGICSFSKLPHEQLTGASGGQFRTRQKNCYPPKLCRTLAALLSHAASAIDAAARWAFFR